MAPYWKQAAGAALFTILSSVDGFVSPTTSSRVATMQLSMADAAIVPAENIR